MSRTTEQNDVVRGEKPYIVLRSFEVYRCAVPLTILYLMKHLLLKLRVLKDTHGQDLIEYALMAGFVAVAAGAIMPNVATSISTIFSKIGSVMSTASTQS